MNRTKAAQTVIPDLMPGNRNPATRTRVGSPDRHYPAGTSGGCTGRKARIWQANAAGVRAGTTWNVV
jgi:hypothetical protein